jgi:thiosulfate dehydrogenase
LLEDFTLYKISAIFVLASITMMEDILKQIRLSLIIIIFLVIVLVGLTITLAIIRETPLTGLASQKENSPLKKPTENKNTMWQGPDLDKITNSKEKETIAYGKELIANTSKYLGPKGLVGRLSNGMNCQNCHMDAGTKPFGNNYSAVYATYPKFRARSGTNETIVKRISDCIERSLNGTAPDSSSKEIKAMVAYIKFLGTDVKKGVTPNGAGLEKLAYLNRAADPVKGKIAYQSKCTPCHGAKGEGILSEDRISFIYPPLWGSKSYNDAAGLYRISKFASYVKNNMPFGASYKNKLLSDEEAWDLAAFVNSQPRPHKDQKNDWKDIAQKPIDFPFGPYSDSFSETQHKFGPFAPIEETTKKSK